MLEKLFGRGSKKKEESQAGPAIHFGRYSDNNKPVAKINRWTDADNLFKDKRYPESLDAFFEYLRDDSIPNVDYQRQGPEGRFSIYQGSKIVRGMFDQEHVQAEVTLARMPQPSTPVMRRLLEMNFSLYYSRFALDNDRLCMRFDTDLETANPTKLYYGLKELATRADKQDDLLVQDFSILETIDSGHITEIPLNEKEVKFAYFRQWIQETLEAVASVDADKFSGGNAYMLLALLFRIDYLLSPEGKLLRELEKIAGIYFTREERPAVEKNRDMVEAFKKLLLIPQEEIFSNLFRSKYTFSIVAPQPYKTVTDSIHNTNQNIPWYRDNNYPFIATQVAEYGIAFCQYSYSLPKVITEFFHLFMMINYAAYFLSLGFTESYYDPQTNQFNSLSIINAIKEIQDRWKDKYPHMDFKTQNLRFDNMVNFDFSFTNELEFLNMDSK